MLPLNSRVASGFNQLVPQHTGTFVGVTGAFASDGTLYADPSIGLSAGYIWWHYENERSQDRALIGGRLLGAAFRSGVRILLGYNNAGSLVAIEAVDDEVNAPYQRDIATGILDGISVLPAALLDVAQVTPSGAGGFVLQVNAYPGEFWGATQIDVSALNSAPAGQVALGIVTRDPATGNVTLQGATTTPYAATTQGIDASFFSGISVPDGVYPLAGIAVASGTTEITNTTLATFGASIIDLRLHLSTSGVTTGYVILTPGSLTRNTVQPTGDYPALILKNNASQTVAPFQHQSSAGAVLASIDKDGNLFAQHAAFGGAAINTNHVINVDKTFGNIAATTRGVSGAVTATDSANNSNILMGGNFTATVNQNGFNHTAATGARGFSATVIASGASGTVTGMAAVQTTLLNTGAGTVTSLYGLYVPGAANSGGGTITGIAGLMLAAQTVATNNTLVLLGTATIPTGNWVIYSTSANNSSLAGALGLGGNFTPTNVLSLSGQAARTIWMERHTTANTAGNNLTAQAGGATTGATDKAGGNQIIAPGIHTGNATPALVLIKGYSKSVTSGTGDATLLNREMIGGTKSLTNNSATTVLSFTAAAGDAINAIVRYSITVKDGTDIQTETGFVVVSGINKAGAFTVSSTEVNSQQNAPVGTLATTWTISSANPAVLSVNANSSLTPSSGYPLITYTVDNLSQQDVAAA